MIHRLRYFAFFLILTGCLPELVIAATTNVVYVNGIQNTLEQAIETMDNIKLILNQSKNHAGEKKRVFNSVSVIWNPIGWDGTKSGPNLTQDEMELFLEKTAEEHFSEDFQKIIAPHNQYSVIDKGAALRITSYLDDMTPGGNSLESEGKITDANMRRTQKAIFQIVSRVISRQPAIVVAHSQGNLLANLAFARLAADYGDAVYNMIRVVNVANTSVFSVNGLNFTHAKDAALFSAATDKEDFDLSLETLPSRGSNWTRTTPRCSNAACDFILASAPFAGVDNTGGWLDHQMNETYLSTVDLPGVLIDQGVSFSASAVRFVDRFEDFVYAAAASFELPLAPPTYPTTCKGKSTVMNGWTRFGTATFDASTNTYGVGDTLVNDPTDSDNDCNAPASWTPGGKNVQDNDFLVYNRFATGDIDFSAKACISQSVLSAHSLGLAVVDPLFTGLPGSGHSPFTEGMATFAVQWNMPGVLTYLVGAGGSWVAVPGAVLTDKGFCGTYRMTRVGNLYSVYFNNTFLASRGGSTAAIVPLVIAYDNVVTLAPTIVFGPGGP